MLAAKGPDGEKMPGSTANAVSEHNGLTALMSAAQNGQVTPSPSIRKAEMFSN